MQFGARHPSSSFISEGDRLTASEPVRGVKHIHSTQVRCQRANRPISGARNRVPRRGCPGEDKNGARFRQPQAPFVRRASERYSQLLDIAQIDANRRIEKVGAGCPSQTINDSRSAE